LKVIPLSFCYLFLLCKNRCSNLCYSRILSVCADCLRRMGTLTHTIIFYYTYYLIKNQLNRKGLTFWLKFFHKMHGAYKQKLRLDKINDTTLPCRSLHSVFHRAGAHKPFCILYKTIVLLLSGIKKQQRHHTSAAIYFILRKFPGFSPVFSVRGNQRRGFCKLLPQYPFAPC